MGQTDSHAVRSGRFRLSPGEVKSPRFEAGDGRGHGARMPLPSPWGLNLDYEEEESCKYFE